MKEHAKLVACNWCWRVSYNRHGYIIGEHDRHNNNLIRRVEIKTENGHFMEEISIEPRTNMPSQECQGQTTMIGSAHHGCTQHAHTSEAAQHSPCTGVADLPETQIIPGQPTKMAVPIHYRQPIQRVPAYLPFGPQESSFSPNGSWRTLSVESKSASTSSGYGTPCAVHGEGHCQHTSVPCNSTSSGYLTKNGSNLDCDVVVVDTKADSAIAYKKRSYNAPKQRSGNIYWQRLNDNLSHLRRSISQRQLSADQARLYGVVAEPRNQQIRQYYPVYRLSQQHSSQNNRDGCSFCRDHCNYSYNFYGLRNCPHFSFSSSATNALWRENDGDYSPRRVVRPSPHIYPIVSKWKSESDLREHNRFNVGVRTLDEEATVVYNELLDAAEMLASMEQKSKSSGARCMDNSLQPPPIPQRQKSCYGLPALFSAKECKEQATPRPILKPLDKRRQRRMDRQCTPTNMKPGGDPRNSRFIHHLESSMNAPTIDRDEESALAALEAAVSLEFPKSTPGKFFNSGCKNGPTQIIRAYLGETEDGWAEHQSPYANGNTSSGNYSCIEVDDDDDTEKLGSETLPPDTLVTEALEGTNCPSDLEV
ncbi:hypothetical protein TcWFU_009312 [Taenia crassiceps]|uniref:Uncharacterized protein n=1 Tax=Taenia crassiceps TaxID=6207 RepID=A0ABR4QM91_9CEST